MQAGTSGSEDSTDQQAPGDGAVRDRPGVTDGAAHPGLMEAFWEYERALMENDLVELDRLFALGDDTLRGDESGLLVGHAAISSFRKGRNGVPRRRIVETHVRELAPRTALVLAVTETATGGRGQQTQIWQHGDDGWRITVAHVAVGAPALDRRIWRVVGDPLVPSTTEGPLTGHGVAVKDLFGIEGHPVGAGNPARLREVAPATVTATAVTALLSAGADVVGITRTDEFAYSLAGANEHYGTPPNPRAPRRISGGSSSGSASAVASGHASIGLGTDTGGSIRVPAAYQGLYGIRTTHGSVSTAGLLPLAQSFDTVGWLARDIGTLRAVGTALLPEVPTRPFDRVLMSSALLGLAEEDVRSALEQFVSTWPHDLPPVHSVDFDTTELPEWLKAFQTIQGREAWANHGNWVSAHWDDMASDVAARFRTAQKYDDAAETHARATAAIARERVRALVGQDVLLVPSASSVAPLLADSAKGGSEIERIRTATLQLTCLAGLAGLPAVSVPVSTRDGLPCGACLIGPAGSDMALMELAEALHRKDGSS